MEFKGTKGEWKYSLLQTKGEMCDVLIYSEFTYGSKRIGSLQIPNSYLGRDGKLDECTVESNAQLIASAPDLLKALIESQKHLVEIGTEDSGQQYYSNMQAINKALNK